MISTQKFKFFIASSHTETPVPLTHLFRSLSLTLSSFPLPTSRASDPSTRYTSTTSFFLFFLFWTSWTFLNAFWWLTRPQMAIILFFAETLSALPFVYFFSLSPFYLLLGNFFFFHFDVHQWGFCQKWTNSVGESSNFLLFFCFEKWVWSKINPKNVLYIFFLNYILALFSFSFCKTQERFMF